MRYILKISYLGGNYSGFQRQPDKITIQETLEKTLSTVCKEDIKLTASGRTDAGVSAMCQVCHLDVSYEIVPNKVLSYVNSLLPKDIRILDLYQTDESFNARFSAKRKTYEYYFYFGMENAVYEGFAVHIGKDIDINGMTDACKYIVGEHDFGSFCASNTDVVDKTRQVYECKIECVNDGLYKLVICGNGFLYNMVRIIMGTLVAVGLKKIKSDDVKDIIEKKDRSFAGKTMPSKGLILKNVEY